MSTSRVDYSKWSRNQARHQLLEGSSARLELLTHPQVIAFRENTKSYRWKCLGCSTGHTNPKEKDKPDTLFCESCSTGWKDLGAAYLPMPHITFEATEGGDCLWVCPGCNSWERCGTTTPEYMRCRTCCTRWKMVGIGGMQNEGVYVASKTKIELIFENNA